MEPVATSKLMDQRKFRIESLLDRHALHVGMLGEHSICTVRKLRGEIVLHTYPLL